MEKWSGGRLCALVLLWALSCAGTQGEEVTYFRERGELKLQPSVVGSVTAVTWKHGSSVLAEWMEGVLPLSYYGGYQGRATLNTSNGELLIWDAGLDDGGEYTLEVNGVIQERPYVARLLPQLPTPLISVEPPNCNDESYQCVLVCGGVMEVKEVSYAWRVEGGPWEKGGREMRIHNDEETQEVKEFTCRLENPLENRESKATRNPFYQPPLDNNTIDLRVDNRRGLMFVVGVYGFIIIICVVLEKWIKTRRRGRITQAQQNLPLVDQTPADSPVAPAPSSPPSSPSAVIINSVQEAEEEVASRADAAPSD